jgi:hypothetical protein
MLLMLNSLQSKSCSVGAPGLTKLGRNPSREGYLRTLLRRLFTGAWIGAAAWMSYSAALADTPGYELGPQDKIRVSVIEWFTGAGELRSPIIETAWVILNCAGGWLGYSTLSMTADVTTAPKPDQ